MRSRVHGASCCGRAWLPEYRLVFDKRGRDGSAKANLRREPGAHVWGVLYTLAPGDWETLDRSESGYARLAVSVLTQTAGESTRAETYQSEQRLADERPRASYLRMVVEGARAEGLPDDYVRALAATAVLDPADSAPAASG